MHDRHEPAASRPGWRGTLVRIKDRSVADRLSVIAAGLAFYALLASFPALAAVVSIVGLVLDPQRVTESLALLRDVLPPQASDLFLEQLRELSRTSHAALGLGVAGGLLLAWWSSSAAVRALIKALDIAYDVDAQRGFLARLGLALVLSLVGAAAAVVAIAAVVVLPALGGVLGAEARQIVYAARWPFIALVFWVGLLVVYRVGPSREPPRGARLVWGATAATALWLAGSALFSWYVSRFGTYNRTYGSMGAVIVLLLWFMLSSSAVLIGAEINAELERQDRRRQGGTPA